MVSQDTKTVDTQGRDHLQGGTTRVIKFRGKAVEDDDFFSIKKGNWYCGYITTVKNHEGKIEWWIENDSGPAVQVDPTTVGQFIGDMVATELYEGDILKITRSADAKLDIEDVTYHEIVYQAEQHYPAFDLSPYLCDEQNGINFALTTHGISAEVAGNIHDNPELMGEVA